MVSTDQKAIANLIDPQIIILTGENGDLAVLEILIETEEINDIFQMKYIKKDLFYHKWQKEN